MNDTEEIIYSLLYDTENEFIFDISETVGTNIEDCSRYIDGIVGKVNAGGVYILKDSVQVDGDLISWHVKVDRF